jgi:hypothetical protein
MLGGLHPMHSLRLLLVLNGGETWHLLRLLAMYDLQRLMRRVKICGVVTQQIN